MSLWQAARGTSSDRMAPAEVKVPGAEADVIAKGSCGSGIPARPHLPLDQTAEGKSHGFARDLSPGVGSGKSFKRPEFDHDQISDDFFRIPVSVSVTRERQGICIAPGLKDLCPVARCGPVFASR